MTANDVTQESLMLNNIPGYFKGCLYTILSQIVPGNVILIWTDQLGEAFNTPEYRTTYLSYRTNDGFTDETYRVRMFHEVIMDIAEEIYLPEAKAFELCNIFLLLSENNFAQLHKKLTADYESFKLSLINAAK